MRKCVGESMENARRNDEDLVRPERLVKPSKTLFIVENKAWKMNGAKNGSEQRYQNSVRNKYTSALKTSQTVYEDEISAPIAG